MKGRLVLAGLALASLASAQGTSNSSLDGGLLPFLVACFGGGLLALLTPCVFPMVPVTVSYFSKRTDTSSTRAAVVYCLGIIGAFAVVGVAVTALFGVGSIQNFAANPWVNLILAILFIAMALNLFGLYEIQLPSGLINKLNTKSRTSGSMFGPLLMGTTFALTTFTCTAPIVGAVLATAASSGGYFYPALGMTSFGLAFSLPFLALALFPSYINKMPKSGSWLSAVKPALGFIELMAAVKFLSNADLVWHLGLLTRPVFLITWAVLAFLLAAYLFGLPNGMNKVGLTRRGLGLATLILACFLSLGAAGRPIKGNLGAFLPPDPYPVKSGVVATVDTASKEVQWESDFESALARAKAENKVVFIDFTGVTCVNCRLMEDNVFPDPAVKERFGEMVTAKLYTDRGTDEDMANQELQKKLANTIALPVYVLLKPDGTTVIKKYEGLAPSPEAFVEFLDEARSSS